MTVVAIIFASFVMVSAIEQPTITIESASDVEAGSSVSIDVVLRGSAAAIKLKFAVDDGLTINGVKNKTSLQGSGYNSEKGTITLYGPSNITDVTLMTVDIDVAADASGSLKICAFAQFTCDDGASGTEFEFEAESGTITVKPKPHTHTYGEPTY